MILTTIQLVLQQFIDELILKEPTLKHVTSTDLSYEQGITYLRADNNLKNTLKNFGEVPVLIWNRSPLRASSKLGKRTFRPLERMPGGDTALCMKIVYGEFDFRYAYAHPDMFHIETFEINHILKQGLRVVEEFSLDLASYGLESLPYIAEWGDLEDLQIQSEGIYHKMITGNVMIQGWFLSVIGESPVILEINTAISNFNNAVITENQITIS